jgi:hypothetical protein
MFQEFLILAFSNISTERSVAMRFSRVEIEVGLSNSGRRIVARFMQTAYNIVVISRKTRIKVFGDEEGRGKRCCLSMCRKADNKYLEAKARGRIITKGKRGILFLDEISFDKIAPAR